MVQFPSKKHITMKKEDGMMGNLSGYLVGVSIFLKQISPPTWGQIIQIAHQVIQAVPKLHPRSLEVT